MFLGLPDFPRLTVLRWGGRAALLLLVTPEEGTDDVAVFRLSRWSKPLLELWVWESPMIQAW